MRMHVSTVNTCVHLRVLTAISGLNYVTPGQNPAEQTVSHMSYLPKSNTNFQGRAPVISRTTHSLVDLQKRALRKGTLSDTKL